MKKISFFLTFLIGIVSIGVVADVKMPSIFSDNMVLQRDATVPVWGTADANEKITVTFGDQIKSVVTDSSGKWKISLDKLSANKKPTELTVEGKNKLTFNNVLVRDVWLCSGQSNMEWSVKKSDNATEEIKNANHSTIRLFQVNRGWSDTERDNVEAKWNECTSSNIPNFSAIGYFFGRELNKELDVPVGLINASWGGTRIEPWTSKIGFENIPALKSIADRLDSITAGSVSNKALTAKALSDYTKWLENAKKAEKEGILIPEAPQYPRNLRPISKDGAPHQQPTTLYNAMIAPYVPYAIKGSIWYQGEANLAEGMLYYEKMKALIASWRKEFKNPELPIYFAQLAPFNYGGDNTRLPKIWVAQERFAKEDKYAGMAVINDIGNLKDIHPKNKQTVGKRLALHALKKDFGKNVKCESPTVKDVKYEVDKVVITFNDAETLTTRDNKSPDCFEIAGVDGVFHKADAEISGNTIIAKNSKVTSPLLVRFAWDQVAEPNLRNEAGLQVGAFSHGEIPVRAVFDKFVPDAKDFKVVYSLNPLIRHGHEVNYTVDNTAELSGRIKRIGYFMHIVDNNMESKFVFVTMDPFTQDIKKIGVPTKNSGARFQTYVNNLEVVSNTQSVSTGKFERGNIEFWDCNYGQNNAAKIPGASNSTFDFGDQMATGASPGYGSMQIHNTDHKHTIFAFNKWNSSPTCDLGIGNQPSGNPDWTFSGSGKNYKSAQILVLIDLE